MRHQPRQLRRLRWCLREIKLYFIFAAILRRVAMELRQTPVFDTFFLPKRERKYQRKRFRAAARTPRGHRSCSALSALEMRRRLQSCYCSSQNEALAPLIERKAYVFGCSRGVQFNTPEGKGAWTYGFFIAISKSSFCQNVCHCTGFFFLYFYWLRQ